MRRGILTFGILLLIAAFVVMQQGIQVLVPIAKTMGLASQTQVEHAVIAPTLFTVPASNYTYLSSDLTEGSDVRGSLEVVGDRELAFYVMDEGNFTAWRRQQPSEVIVARAVVISYNFTFTVPSTGAYYFVFDNQDLTRRALIFGLTVVQHETVLHPVVVFASYELLVLGAIVAIVGIRTGSRSTTKARGEPVQMIEESVRCRFCSSELGADTVFCGNCGRSQR